VLILVDSTPNQDIYYGFMVSYASQRQHVLSEYTLFWDQILFCDQQVVSLNKTKPYMVAICRRVSPTSSVNIVLSVNAGVILVGKVSSSIYSVFS